MNNLLFSKSQLDIFRQLLITCLIESKEYVTYVKQHLKNSNLFTKVVQLSFHNGVYLDNVIRDSPPPPHPLFY